MSLAAMIGAGKCKHTSVRIRVKGTSFRRTGVKLEWGRISNTAVVHAVAAVLPCQTDSNGTSQVVSMEKSGQEEYYQVRILLGPLHARQTLESVY